MVRARGLEPPWGKPHTDLNRTRLPIPPRPRVTRKTSEQNNTPACKSTQAFICSIFSNSARYVSAHGVRGVPRYSALAGTVLPLRAVRVSPSGKARASQARIRGFESRHPLHKAPAASTRRPYIIGKALMANERQHIDRKEAVKDAASGYSAVVLATVCFILFLALITVIVRFIVGAGASA